MIGSLIRVRWLTSATVRPARPRASASASPTRTPRLHCSTEPPAAPPRRAGGHDPPHYRYARRGTNQKWPWGIQPRRRPRPGGAHGSARAGVNHGPDPRLGGLETEESDRPGQAGPLPRPEIGVRGKLGDQVERGAAGPRVADLGG